MAGLRSKERVSGTMLHKDYLHRILFRARRYSDIPISAGFPAAAAFWR
jgi:hypothetical protein